MRSIRLAVGEDCTAIASIYNDAISHQRSADMDPVSTVNRQEWLARHTWPHAVFVLEEDGSVLGWSSISPYRPGRRALAGAVEVSYYVDYEHHKKGIGAALLSHAIDHSISSGFDTIFAILLDDNGPSIALLEKFGFEQWGHLPGIANFDGKRVGQVYYGRTVNRQARTDIPAASG
ncbi:MAG: N-acetyltransferase [Rhodothermales bacterium]|nr:N-acetyltransferase [Rhodothermales bacterium]